MNHEALTLALPADVVEEIARRAAAIVAADIHQPEPWIGVKQAAEHIDARPQRVYDLVSAKRIPYVKEGSRLLFRRSDLDRWLTEETR